MKKAIQLCKPGGRIVYSTCTFAPEENEGVVTAVLNKFGDQVRIKPIELENFVWSQGISSWQDQTFHPDVKHTMRVWPHQNNTGGFYVAVFEKYRGDGFEYDAPEELFTNKGEIDHYLKDLQERYQFSDNMLSQFALQQASNRGIYMVNKDHKVPLSLSKDVSGLIFMKTRTNFPKLSTGASVVIGQYAQQNVVTLSDEQFTSYLKREECVLSQEQISDCTDTGFVIVKFDGHVAGLGLYLSAQQDKPPRLQSLFPKNV
jgi:NOL1/NOP2/fmu family ribosome biogenesis protein